MKRSRFVVVVLALCLSVPAVSRAQDGRQRFLLVQLSGGLVSPLGNFSDDFRAGGMAALGLGVTGRRFGVRIMTGSIEPGTRGSTNDTYSARQGRPIEVDYAVLPVELQGIAAFPEHTSRLGLLLQGGIGAHFTNLRIKGTDTRLEHETRFGYSMGAGGRYAFAFFGRRRDAQVGLDVVYRDTDGRHMLTTEFVVTAVL